MAGKTEQDCRRRLEAKNRVTQVGVEAWVLVQSLVIVDACQASVTKESVQKRFHLAHFLQTLASLSLPFESTRQQELSNP